MPWDWEKLLKQRQRRSGGPPAQMGEVFNKIRGAKGKFPGIWIIIIALILFYMGSSIFYTVGVDNGKIAAIFEYRNQSASLLDLFDETNSAAGLNVARVEVKYASIPDKPM
jgi:hypothetical protein